MRLPKSAHSIAAFSSLPAEHLNQHNLTRQAKAL